MARPLPGKDLDRKIEAEKWVRLVSFCLLSFCLNWKDRSAGSDAHSDLQESEGYGVCVSRKILMSATSETTSTPKARQCSITSRA